jgi:hypothetical protein
VFPPVVGVWPRSLRYEREFVWNKRNTFEMGYMVLGMSVAIYGMSVWTVRHTDARNHYPQVVPGCYCGWDLD